MLLAVVNAGLILAPTARRLIPIASVFVGPALLSLATLALLRRRLGAEALVLSFAGSILAWALALLAALSWSIGFDEADAGTTRSPIGSAFVPLFVAAWLVGIGATAPVLAASGGRRRRRRVVGSIAIAVPLVPLLGMSVLTPTVGVLVGVLLVYLSRPRLSRGSTTARRKAAPSRRSTAAWLRSASPSRSPPRSGRPLW